MASLFERTHVCPPATREPGLSGAVPGDRRGDRPGGRRVHPADRAIGDAAVSRGRRAVAAPAVPGGRFARHRLSAVPFFSRRARQRRASDQGCAVRERRIISLRTVLGKFFCTSATLASGIPLGREGPSVQVGAGIGSVLGRTLGLSPEQVKKLIPVGAAAAIAAAFNTPLAAVVFSLEEIMGDLQRADDGRVVLASATAWVVLRLSLGDHPLFKVPQYHLVSPAEFAVYAVLGVAGGVVSAVFAKLLLGMRARFLRLPRKTVWFQPVAGGLLVGVMGWFVPQVLGVGYGYVGDALNGNMAFRLMLLLLVLKLIAVTTSYASGNAGGIFGPALFIGAMVGGAVGTVAHHFFPAYTATPGAYALVGMGAVFAGVVRAP